MKLLALVSAIILFFAVSRQIFGHNTTPNYSFAKVERKDITEVVAEAGKITANNQSDIYSPANGLVTEVFIANGDYVKAGQPLLTVKSSATEQEKSAALANYLAAKNSLDTANAAMLSLQSVMFGKWDAFKALAESDEYEEPNGTPKHNQRALAEFHVAEKDWLAAEANYKKQQAVISQAQAAVSSSYLLYQATQDATVKATAEGEIANLSVSAGNTVSTKTVTATLPLLTITNKNVVEVTVSLNETDIAKVSPGQEVVIEVSAYDNGTYQGIVRRVDSIGTETAGVVRYRDYIEITNPNEKLRSGMSVDVDIITQKLTGVLSVPNSAVKPYQGGRAVRVLDPKTKEIKFVPVEIGIKGTQMTEIKSGIEEGQEIVTALPNDQVRRPGLFGN